jgi:hypothetical protein
MAFMNEINFNVEDVEQMNLSIGMGIKKIYPPIENLEVTPTKEQQTFNHENSYGYDNVTVNAIPDEYIIPDGTLEITENTTYDVTPYSRVSASVHPTPNLQDKKITITENGTQNITYDEGYDGLNSVETSVNVSTKVKVTSLAELNVALDNCVVAFRDYFAEFISTQYGAYTDQPVTLYSPAKTNLIYAIRYRNNLYQIIWFPNHLLLQQKNNSSLYVTTMIVDRLDGLDKNFNAHFGMSGSSSYTSPTYATLDEAIVAIQSNTTKYTATGGGDWGTMNGPNGPVPYTNGVYFDPSYNMLTNKRISYNETIEVIQ